MNMRKVGLVGVAAVVCLQAWPIGVGPSRLVVRSDEVHFPVVSGYNLDREELIFPRDFGGELNIVFVPFRRHHQATVDTWIPFAQEVEATRPGVGYYELPTIDEMGMLRRTLLNEGMRAGIPDQTARERTVTLYLDTRKFRKATAIPGTDQVHVLLVNRDGDILWRTTGNHTEAKGEALLAALEDARRDG